MMPTAMRSLTDPPGFAASSLTNIETRGGARRWMRTTGVRPIVWQTSSWIMAAPSYGGIGGGNRGLRRTTWTRDMGGAVGRNVGTAASLRIQLLGPFSVRRDGAPVPLPRSRKVRALLAFLALGGASYSRSRLCALLWDVPNDPRGELRWCLSKLRALLDDPGRRRVQ